MSQKAPQIIRKNLTKHLQNEGMQTAAKIRESEPSKRTRKGIQIEYGDYMGNTAGQPTTNSNTEVKLQLALLFSKTGILMLRLESVREGVDNS